jgi:hypothetical protein
MKEEPIHSMWQDESDSPVDEPSQAADEPSVLDYFKSKLSPWKHKPVVIENVGIEQITEPNTDGLEPREVVSQEVAVSPRPVTHKSWPWRSLVTLVLALLAQMMLNPRPERTWQVGAALYLIAFAWMVYTTLKNEWLVAPLLEAETRADTLTGKLLPLAISLPTAFLAFWLFSNNRFNTLNVTLWLVAILTFIAAFWQRPEGISPFRERLNTWIRQPNLQIKISREFIAVLLVVGIVLFYRLYQLNLVPPEMNSDHAEKLYDVMDVLNGQYSIFFPRNTGREAMQFYLTVTVIKIFNTGISFLSLKIGTAIAGLLTLPFIYLLGKELGSKKAGLIAVLLAGTAYWPNVITRVALRFTFYPLFVAPTLYYLLRGLRRSNRNDFILAGLFLGAGLHTYVPFRIVPILVVVIVILYLLHRSTKEARRTAVFGFLIVTLLSLIIFVPLLKYAQENPGMFAYRSLTRLGDLEKPLDGPAWLIFTKNLWNAMVMFAWDNGEIWPLSITHRPALDTISAGLFYLGFILFFIRYLRHRHWQDLALLISIPILMLPSILSLAFPHENPALNRTGGAIVPVFLIIGFSLEGFLEVIRTSFKQARGKWAAGTAGVLLVGIILSQNFDLVFNQYYLQYEMSSWNTSELGEVIKAFSETMGSLDTAWVVAYPHWVDTRLVGINAGNPTRDYAISPEQLAGTVEDPSVKLFIINPADQASIDTLKNLYPQGWLKLFQSKVPTKDFWMFVVFPQANEDTITPP